ncbi:ABC-three component system protein [Poseidonibacter lekithochrous]|uniref:ABC-three component system protein n=1 Tax=Poseidonibacter lekithochrous TaxID=1904463 RepID=UPI000D3B09CA|nr:ABC-three component system protein [Poseidonibacter lekithochrous]
MDWKKRKPNGFKKSSVLTENHDIWRKKYKKLLNTAISSWSGFVYQGKIAILYVLQELGNDSYTLQLDSLEDFAILNEIGVPVSLHQVKAKKSNYFNDYQEAFEKLKEGGETIECRNLFFHLAQPINDKEILDIENEFDPVKVYSYDSVPYCEVNQINTKIEDIIISLQPLGRQSRDYATKVRKYLDNLVSEKLFEIHKIIHLNLLGEEDAAFQQRILFSDFKDILNKDLNQEDLGDSYYLYQIKIDISRYYQDYCVEYDLEEEVLKRMNNFITFFIDLDNSELINFIKNIMPHRTFKFESLSDYKDNSPQQTEIKYVFLYILHQIEKDPIYLNKCLIQWQKDGKIFAPTCINANQRDAVSVCDQIIKNGLSTDLKLLYESHNLITDSINLNSIKTSHIVRNNYQTGDEDYLHIMKWNDVSLVKIDDIKGDING